MSTPFDRTRHVFHSPQFRRVVEEAIRFLNATPGYALPPPKRFLGAGVYALYYVGGFDLYRELASKNAAGPAMPIYVGKAVPAGWRTVRAQRSQAPDLFRRLCEHSRSIAQVDNLNPGDFRCRFMILQGAEGDLVIPVEAELIRLHTPLWNTVVDGFGNHDPGRGRYDQAPSEWDVLHPGRPWAARLRGIPPDRVQAVKRVEEYLSKLSA